jgi:hypothetical protein
MTKREEELETLMYFMPSSLKNIEITASDITKYFEWSEKGLHKKDKKDKLFDDGFNALVQAKRSRGIHMHELYEPGILEGSIPYRVILEDTPESVMMFMSNEMFKGMDRELIQSVWKDVNEPKYIKVIRYIMLLLPVWTRRFFSREVQSLIFKV